jgi:hypothetical protein
MYGGWNRILPFGMLACTATLISLLWLWLSARRP